MTISIQDLPLEMRADAVSSMVYEASARLRDPVYGCAGTIWQLQEHVSKLQLEKAILQAELLHMNLHQANITAYIRENLHSVEGGDQSISEPFSHTLSTSHEGAVSSFGELPNGYQLSDARDKDDQSLPELWDPSWL